jgi:type II pantothenate kinase
MSFVNNNVLPKILLSTICFYEQVIGKGKFERIIGSHLGGGTILGLARLLTGCSRYYPISGIRLPSG